MSVEAATIKGSRVSTNILHIRWKRGDGMDLFKCCICGEVVDIEDDEVEYDEQEDIYCSPCFMTESDTGDDF